MSSYTRPADHHSMALDDIRNAYYFSALADHVKTTSRVLDLGAGVGVLGLEAARLGAAHTYLVDPAAAVHCGAEIARENGLADRVSVLQGKGSKLELDQPVDIILSVFTGNFLLDEDLLPFLFEARDRYLAPNGILLPDNGRMFVAPVDMADHYHRHVECWADDSRHLNYRSVRRYAANTPLFDRFRDPEPLMLSTPALLHELDFNYATHTDCDNTISLYCNRPGTCNGLLGWFDMHLGRQWLSTGPQAEPTHWSQAFLPLEEPLSVVAGDRIDIRVRRKRESHWNWEVTRGGRKQRQSSFLAAPITPGSLDREKVPETPRLSAQGQALLEALQAMDGTRSMEQLRASLYAEHAAAFDSVEELQDLLTATARRFGKP